MPNDVSGRVVIRDSAIIITGTTVLLFVWGYAFEAFGWRGASVPGFFQPEVAVQERALIGGILGLFIFLPLALLCWVFDILVGGRIHRWFECKWRLSFFHQIVIGILLFATSVALVRPIASVSNRFGHRLRVESVTLKSGAPTVVRKGMYCIGKRGSTYVFVDRLGGSARTVYLLAEEDVSSLVLSYAR